MGTELLVIAFFPGGPIGLRAISRTFCSERFRNGENFRRFRDGFNFARQ